MIFSHFRSFLAGLPGPSPQDDTPDKDPRLAVVALLLQLIDADGERKDVEMQTLHTTLCEAYEMNESDAKQLINKAEKAAQGSVDLYEFTKVLTAELSYEKRQEFVEMMWETVFADRHLHEFEDHVLWRIAELIGIDREQRVALRQRVQARLGVDRSGAEISS